MLGNNDSAQTQTLLFGNTSFKSNKTLVLLIATIDYNLIPMRSDKPLY